MLKALLVAERNARVTGFPGPIPTSLIEVLGAPLLARLTEQLERSGIGEIVVVTDINLRSLPTAPNLRYVYSATEDLWKAAERTFEEFEAVGVRGVVVTRADHYAEVDWQGVLSHHLHFRNRATRVYCGDDECDMYLVSPGRRNEAALLMRSRLKDCRTPGVRYAVGALEYVNLLVNCHELRTLCKDALYGVNQIKPHGVESKPGVWLDLNARVHRSARVVAPAFIGAYAHVEAEAVVTRDSVVEHHSFVDCETVVEDCWLQPYTAVGVGLELTGALACGNRMFHLKRGVEFETTDPLLIREQKESIAARSLQAAAAFVARATERKAAAATAAPQRKLDVIAGETGRNADQTKLAPGIALMRRYGNE
jgi:carbonic anhydrase/acetyltransferase-like protein (isoleucine patch superfamily)